MNWWKFYFGVGGLIPFLGFRRSYKGPHVIDTLEFEWFRFGITIAEKIVK